MSDMIIFIICLTVFVFSFSTSGYCGSLYRCVNSQGSVMLTDNIPTNPDYKCTFAASYKESTPADRTNERQKPYNAPREKQREAYSNTATTPKISSSTIAMEKKRIQDQIRREEDKIDQDKRKYGRNFVKPAEEWLEQKKNDLRLLESNPEQYFYEKKEHEKNIKDHPVVIDPSTGRVVPGAIISQ